MRAAVLVETNRPLVVEDVHAVDPGPRDVVVRILASGVCHSDVSAASGGLDIGPSILGHEGAGVVEQVGPEVRRFRVGDRVIGSLIPSCGDCWFCERGQSFLCERSYDFLHTPRATRDDGTELRALIGTFAEQMTVSENNLVKVETDLPDEQLALIGCGVTTGVGAVLNTARVHPGASVVVIGCGGVGQAAIQGARVAGAGRIIAVDPQAAKRDHALKLGATDAIDPADAEPVAAVKELTHGRGADYAFEVVGSSDLLMQAYQCVRRGGTVVAVGIPHGAPTLALPASLVSDGKHVVGCVYGTARVREFFPMLVGMVERGQLDVASMVSRTIALSDVNGAFEAIESGDVVRSVITSFD